MKEYIQNLVQRNGLRLSLVLIIIIAVLNAVLVIYYRSIIINSSDTELQIQEIRNELNYIENNINLADVGVRAYIIKQTDELLAPFIEAETGYVDNLNQLENNLNSIGFDIIKMEPARAAIEGYMKSCQLMVDLIKEGRLDEAIGIFEEDRGDIAWERFSPFIEESTIFVDDLETRSQEDYKQSINRILITQVIFIMIIIPILVLAFRKIASDDRFKFKIFQLIDESNRSFLFDDGQEIAIRNEDSIIERMVLNLKKAAAFINKITQGQYDVTWDGMDESVKELNKSNIAGELHMMRDQMRKAKKVDEIRIWTNEGLSKFADLIRSYQNNLHDLSEELISNIVTYIGAQQGGLFFVSEDNQQTKYLELMGCYAYQRKKFLEKRIEIGQGMVGQCFLEGETTYLTNIPSEYVHITSGLGETNPTTLLVVPLKINEEIVGVLELASIKPMEQHQIDFIERLAETVASSINSVKINESTRILLEQSQQQAEEMRAQEEEMRQNMEELQATQEQIHRKNEEVENLLSQSSQNEESMKLQMDALEELQDEAARTMEQMEEDSRNYKEMLMDILDELPHKIFLKDAEGKMYLANKKVADAHGIPLSELIGKSDYDFVDKETADEWRAQELEIMKKGEERYVFEDKIGGKKAILESVKKVFRIKTLNQEGLLGIQTDITEKVELESKLKNSGNK